MPLRKNKGRTTYPTAPAPPPTATQVMRTIAQRHSAEALESALRPPASGPAAAAAARLIGDRSDDSNRPRSSATTEAASQIQVCECGDSRGVHPARGPCLMRGCSCSAYVFRPALPPRLDDTSGGGHVPHAHARRARKAPIRSAPRGRQAALR